MSRYVAALAVTVATAACGGKVNEVTPPNDGGADTARDGDSVDVAADGLTGFPCRLSDGTPTCGVASCPSPHPAGCTTCPRAANRDLQTAPLGICDEDASEVFAAIDGKGVSCPGCPSADDVCLFRGVDYVCVRRPLCDALAASAFKACFFQDMSDYVIGPLPSPPCPEEGLGLCGTSCAPCPTNTVCLGRSQAHPFGVCAPLTSSGGKRAASCSRHPVSSAEACVAGTDECVIFKSIDPITQAAADEAGVCVSSGRCRGIRGLIPGGVVCVDSRGDELP